MAEHARHTINELPNLVIRPQDEADSIYLDNAATTPFLKPIEEAVAAAKESYGSVHRGNGRRARASTEAYEGARQEVANFFGLTNEYELIFTNNTTSAINTLASALLGDSPLPSGVITSRLEHHSNDLPWRQAYSGVDYADINPYDGSISIDHLASLIKQRQRRARVVAITGGSNLTGHLPDIKAITEQAHSIGAIMAVDGAQWAPHRKINVAELDIDALAVSGHKMYAPYNIGALIVKKNILKDCPPVFPGGGTIDMVTQRTIDWAPLPDRFEPGTPNLLGALAFAAATQLLDEIGMDTIAQHESRLTKLALTHMQHIKGVTVYGDRDPQFASNRLGVLPFTLEGVSHAKMAAILGEEHNVDCRNGCFCAHMAVTKLLGITDEGVRFTRAAVTRGDKRKVPGMVRFSWGAHTTERELMAGINGVRQIAAGNYNDTYVQDARTGQFSSLSR